MVGFHYIWIDNLCIVQDSPEDWQQQSAAMSDVYKSAALNIAALEAAADEAGFLFAERDAYCEFGFTADFDSILGHAVGEVGLRLRSRQEECRLLGRSTIVWKDVHEPAQPLNSRAWVYQERTFARRMLGFRQNQMAWYCRQMERSESDSPNVSLRSSLHTHWTARSEYNYPRQIPKKLSVEASWETVIKEYSALKLTRQTDKLIAVSAIAKEIAVPGTRYYAGLWSSNLWAQLGWRTSNGLPAASPRAQVGDEMYVAPSWSWASIDCHCDYKYVSLNFRGPSTASQRHGEVLDIRTEHIGFEFGQVSSGRMRLRAYLNPAFQLMSTNYRKRKDVELELSVNMDEERVPDQGRDDTPDRGPLFKNQLSGDLMCFVFDTVGDADLDPSQYHLVRWMPLVQAVFLVLLRVEQPSGSCIPQSDSGLEVYTAHRHW
nr:hypothetical protein B0A51_00521 [Rachicladosporium sp. CCFEE 5018]